jgi:hypothetical protein
VGRRVEAEEALGRVSPRLGYARALGHHALGRREQAMVELNQAIDERSVLATFVGVDPRWDALRRWEPFRDAARRVNLLEVSDRIAALADGGR